MQSRKLLQHCFHNFKGSHKEVGNSCKKLQVLDDWNKLEHKDFAALRINIRQHLMADHGCDEATMLSEYPTLANYSNRKTKTLAKKKKKKKDDSTKKKKRRKRH